MKMAASLKRTEYYYGSENALQNVAVWQFPEEQQGAAAATAATQQPQQTKYWLM